MTSPDAELRRLAEAATPGPWHEGHHWVYVVPRGCHNPTLRNVLVEVDDGSNHNAAFIAAANSATVLALLDRIEAVRALCAGHTGRTHDTYDEGWVDALNHVLDALDGTS